MKAERLKIVFAVSVYPDQDGKPVMQLRRIIKEEALMKLLASRLQNGQPLNVDGELRVRNVITAQTTLRQAGLID